MAGKRRTNEALAEILEDTERHLVRLRSPGRVAPLMAKKYQGGIRQAYRWIEQVHAKWREESAKDSPEDRGMKRSDMRAVLNEALFQAMNATEVVRDEKGRPMMDPATGKVMTRVVMDVPNVVRTVRQLSKLDGIDAPEAPQRIIVDGQLKHEHGVAKSDKEELISALLSPRASKAG